MDGLVGSIVRINYKLAGYLRFVVGEVIAEDKKSITVLDRQNNRAQIARELIVEIIERNGRGGQHE